MRYVNADIIYVYISKLYINNYIYNIIIGNSIHFIINHYYNFVFSLEYVIFSFFFLNTTELTNLAIKREITITTRQT